MGPQPALRFAESLSSEGRIRADRPGGPKQEASFWDMLEPVVNTIVATRAAVGDFALGRAQDGLFQVSLNKS
jgi:hypothetical protein